MTKSKRRVPLITRTDIIGWMFVLPFVIGAVFFFLRPMITSMVYSFSTISFDDGVMSIEFAGLENYRYALFGDANFFKALLTIGGDVFVKILVIMFLSMFVAMLLNQNFSGRLVFRTIMFLPVIFGADMVITQFVNSGAYSAMSSTGNSFVSVSMEVNDFINELTNSFGILSGMMSVFAEYAQKLFDLTWEMGIQVVLFIVGFQAIPGYLYEVADMEGATKWESFWKITFPLLSPTILLCLIYTVIDNFNADNQIMEMITDNMGIKIHYACAQTWLYSIIVFVMVMLIYGIVSKRTIYLD